MLRYLWYKYSTEILKNPTVREVDFCLTNTARNNCKCCRRMEGKHLMNSCQIFLVSFPPLKFNCFHSLMSEDLEFF